MEKLNPTILIFDLDGVLVDVRDSYHRSIIETVRRFTARRVHPRDLHRWKNRSGYNDDWKLTFDWIRALGGRPRYAEVTRVFQQLYRGRNFDGYIAREKWLLPRPNLERLARRAELTIFTGRPRREVLHTLDKCGVRPLFRHLVAVEDVRRSKPSPEGLRQILHGRDPRQAFYLGDHVDDALAAQRARVAFLGVLPPRSATRHLRAGRLKQLGAVRLLGHVREVEKCLV